MKLAFLINTPAQVHFWRNIIKILESRGHRVDVLARDYGEAIPLFKEYFNSYFVHSKKSDGPYKKIINFPFDMIRAYKYLNAVRPEIILGYGIDSAYISRFLRKPCIIFNDSEPLNNTFFYSQHFKLFLRFVDAYISPDTFKNDFGIKHIKIRSFKEMAYLHPKYFNPDKSVLDYLGIGDNKFVLLRFNAFDALHDIGQWGFSNENKTKLVKELEKYCRVFISSENKLPAELEPYRIKIPLHKIHDVLFYADLLVGDTQTLTTEAGILGTPAIRCNSFVGEKDMGNFIALEKDYGLIFNYNNPEKAIEKAIELIQISNLKKDWSIKKEKLLKETIDVTGFMVWFIENYPASFSKVQENTRLIDRFI